MPAIVKEITIATTPERVFDALTLPDEIARWWTDDLTVKPEVGSLSEFRFRGGFTLQFEIAELKNGEKVYWKLRQGPPQWTGTSVIWQISSNDQETHLTFTQDGFTQVDGVYEQTRGNWEYFLNSLKSYLEEGKGTPGLPTFS